MIRVVLVDDHPVFRRGLAFLLRSEGYDVVAEAASGTEALAAVAASAPDLVVMDLGLPELHGVKATARITAEHPSIRVVVVTMYDDDDTVRAALEAGAAGYVLKDAAPEQVLAAIAAAASGATVIGSGLTLPRGGSGPVEGPLDRARLTARERDVAALIEHGLGNAAIGARLGLTEKTVANYVASVRSKLGANDRHDAARIIREG